MKGLKIATPNPSCDSLSTYDGIAHLTKTGMSQKRFILLCFLQHTAELSHRNQHMDHKDGFNCNLKTTVRLGKTLIVKPMFS